MSLNSHGYKKTWRSLKGHCSGLVCSFGSACCSAFHGTSALQPVYLLPCLLHLANVWALTLGSPSEECGSYLRNTDGHEALSSCPPPPSVLTVCMASLWHLHTTASLWFTTSLWTTASLWFTTKKIQIPDTWKQVLNWFVNPNVSGK